MPLTSSSSSSLGIFLKQCIQTGASKPVVRYIHWGLPGLALSGKEKKHFILVIIIKYHSLRYENHATLSTPVIITGLECVRLRARETWQLHNQWLVCTLYRKVLAPNYIGLNIRLELWSNRQAMTITDITTLAGSRFRTPPISVIKWTCSQIVLRFYSPCIASARRQKTRKVTIYERNRQYYFGQFWQ